VVKKLPFPRSGKAIRDGEGTGGAGQSINPAAEKEDVGDKETALDRFTYFEPPALRMGPGVVYEQLRPSELLKRSAAAYYLIDHPYVPPFADPSAHPRLKEQCSGVLNSNPSLQGAIYRGSVTYHMDIWDGAATEAPLEQEASQGQKNTMSIFGDFCKSDHHGATLKTSECSTQPKHGRGRRRVG